MKFFFKPLYKQCKEVRARISEVGFMLIIWIKIRALMFNISNY